MIDNYRQNFVSYFVVFSLVKVNNQFDIVDLKSNSTDVVIFSFIFFDENTSHFSSDINVIFRLNFIIAIDESFFIIAIDESFSTDLTSSSTTTSITSSTFSKFTFFKTLSIGVEVGIVIDVIVFVFTVFVFAFLFWRRQRKRWTMIKTKNSQKIAHDRSESAKKNSSTSRNVFALSEFVTNMFDK